MEEDILAIYPPWDFLKWKIKPRKKDIGMKQSSQSQLGFCRIFWSIKIKEFSSIYTKISAGR